MVGSEIFITCCHADISAAAADAVSAAVRRGVHCEKNPLFAAKPRFRELWGKEKRRGGGGGGIFLREAPEAIRKKVASAPGTMLVCDKGAACRWRRPAPGGDGRSSKVDHQQL